MLLCVAALATTSSASLLRHTEPTPLHIGAPVHGILTTVNTVHGVYVERMDDIADRHNASVEAILNKAVSPPTLAEILRANKGEDISVPAAKAAGPQAGPQAATAGPSGAFDKTAAEIEEKIKAAHLPGGSLAAGAAKKAKKKTMKKQALAAAGTTTEDEMSEESDEAATKAVVTIPGGVSGGGVMSGGDDEEAKKIATKEQVHQFVGDSILSRLLKKVGPTGGAGATGATGGATGATGATAGTVVMPAGNDPADNFTPVNGGLWMTPKPYVLHVVLVRIVVDVCVARLCAFNYEEAYSKLTLLPKYNKTHC